MKHTKNPCTIVHMWRTRKPQFKTKQDLSILIKPLLFLIYIFILSICFYMFMSFALFFKFLDIATR